MRDKIIQIEVETMLSGWMRGGKKVFVFGEVKVNFMQTREIT